MTPATGTRPKSTVFAALPPVWPEELQLHLAAATRASNRTLVVLDDDPTGTQTVYDVPVVTRWDLATLQAELANEPHCFFILTNSRSLPTEAARALNVELARNLQHASAATRRAFTLVSRSDSTLRGHFPDETDALNEVCGPFDATILAPYFEAGGRYTVDDVHYVAENDTLVPAADTPFARDAAFGYRNSHLPTWVEEKTRGRVRAADVQSLSLDLIRRGGPEAVAAALRCLPDGSTCVANLCSPQDAEVFAAATLAAERTGKKFLYRTAASFISARLGLAPRPLLGPADFAAKGSDRGGLIVVGSYVPKTTAQLQHLLQSSETLQRVELDVAALLDLARRDGLLATAIANVSHALANGQDVLVFTSRGLVTGSNAAASLDIGQRVSDALVTLVRGLGTAPRFVIAKGGITSSDVATRGLGVVRAMVRGQILPGVPVWQLGAETRYPGLQYVVFPGNVGEIDALATTLSKFQRISANK